MGFRVTYGPSYSALANVAALSGDQSRANRRQELVDRMAMQNANDEHQWQMSLGRKSLEYSLENQRKMNELADAESRIDSQPFTETEKAKAHQAIALRRAGIQPSEFWKPDMETPTFHKDESGRDWIRTDRGWEQVKSKEEELAAKREQHQQDTAVKLYLGLSKQNAPDLKTGVAPMTDAQVWAKAQAIARGEAPAEEAAPDPLNGQTVGNDALSGQRAEVAKIAEMLKKGGRLSGATVPVPIAQGVPAAISGPQTVALPPKPGIRRQEIAAPAAQENNPVDAAVELLRVKFTSGVPLTDEEKAFLKAYKARSASQGSVLDDGSGFVF